MNATPADFSKLWNTKVIAYQSQQFPLLFQNFAAINKLIQRVASKALSQMKIQFFCCHFRIIEDIATKIWYARVKWPVLSISDLGMSVSPLLKSQLKDSKLKNCVQKFNFYSPLMHSTESFVLCTSITVNVVPFIIKLLNIFRHDQEI